MMKENKKLNSAFASLTIAVLVIATYLCFSNHRLAMGIHRWQGHLLNDQGNYFPALSILLMALPMLLLLLLVKFILLRLINKKGSFN